MLVEDDKTFTILLTNATEIYNITLEGGTLNIIENEGIYTICKLSTKIIRSLVDGDGTVHISCEMHKQCFYNKMGEINSTKVQNPRRNSFCRSHIQQQLRTYIH